MKIEERSTERRSPIRGADPISNHPGARSRESSAAPEIGSARESSTAPRIRFKTGDGEWQTYPLEIPVVRIGRRADNDVVLHESFISKRTAEIRATGDRHVVCDLNSKAGVFVNGDRVTERVLEDGDVVRFGHASTPTIEYRRGESAPPFRTTSMMDALESSTGERNLRHLAQFLEFNRLLGGRLTVEEILPYAVTMALELTRAERGFLIRKGPNDRLDFLVARHRSGEEIPRSDIRVSESIVKDALEGGEPLVINNVPEDLDLMNRESVAALDLRSAVAIPLLPVARNEEVEQDQPSDRAAFGVLYLDSREAREALGRIDRGLLEALARDVSSVIENARLLRAAEIKKKLEEEMAQAREVQAALLPASFWSDPHFDAAGSCIPCQHLGGDYIGQFRLPDGRCCFLVADVSGHGLSAALLAAAVQGILAAETSTRQPLPTMAARINRALCRIVPEAKYATLFACVLAEDGTLSYVNAGHPPPLMLQRAGGVKFLATGDMAMGFFDSSAYHEGKERLQNGDVVAIYTDGVTEAADAAGELFGEERLESCLLSSADEKAQAIHDAIRSTIQSFSGAEASRDDITLLIVKRIGAGPRAGGRTTSLSSG